MQCKKAVPVAQMTITVLILPKCDDDDVSATGDRHAWSLPMTDASY
jgi:hypothetical protein